MKIRELISEAIKNDDLDTEVVIQIMTRDKDNGSIYSKIVSIELMRLDYVSSIKKACLVVDTRDVDSAKITTFV